MLDVIPVALLPILLAFVTVAAMARARVVGAASAAAAIAVVATPLVHGDPLDIFHLVLPLAALGLALAGGRYMRPRESSVRTSRFRRSSDSALGARL